MLWDKWTLTCHDRHLRPLPSLPDCLSQLRNCERLIRRKSPNFTLHDTLWPGPFLSFSLFYNRHHSRRHAPRIMLLFYPSPVVYLSPTPDKWSASILKSRWCRDRINPSSSINDCRHVSIILPTKKFTFDAETNNLRFKGCVNSGFIT